MQTDFVFRHGDRIFYLIKRKARSISCYAGPGNPTLWFSFEQIGDSRNYLCCGSTNKSEAQRPIDKILRLDQNGISS